MEDQYGMADLRHYTSGRTFFPDTSQRPKLPAGHPYYVLNFCPDNYAGNIAPPRGVGIAASDAVGGLIGAAGFGTEDSDAGRWPRQETLTLLEIRSRLDARFKEANHKGHLWDEVSRIMYDEYRYQRTGKKCREKFENLYKYYKKTKVGKAGRQDGKHYRFFRQLEALYGDKTVNNNHSLASILDQTNFVGPSFMRDFSQNTNALSIVNNNYNIYQESYPSLVSISNSSDFDAIITSEKESVELDILDNPKKTKKLNNKKSLKAEIKDLIDIPMMKMMEKQDAWMEKMTRKIDENEKDRILREEQWRKQDAERVDREKKVWAGEKARILARDSALMEAFGKLAGKDSRVSHQEEALVVERGNGSLKANWDRNGTTWDCGATVSSNAVRKEWV